MVIKKKDFVEIDYTGMLEDGTVFDTTLKDVAQKEGLDTQDSKFKPARVCIGENHMIKGVEEALIGQDAGKKLSINVEPDKGFGRKSAKLLRMIPQGVFKKQNIQPRIGLQVQVDGQMGIIKTANSGRIIVDFNNPLAGKNLKYDIKINKLVTDTKEKLAALVEPMFGEIEIEYKDGNAELMVPMEMPKEVAQPFVEKMKKAIPEAKEIVFKVKSEKTKASEKITPQK